jgi:hypothetical protein
MYAFLLSAAKPTYCTTSIFPLFLKVPATEPWDLASTKEVCIPHWLYKTGNLLESVHSHCVGVTSQANAVNACTDNYQPDCFHRSTPSSAWGMAFTRGGLSPSAEETSCERSLRLFLLMYSQVILLTGSPPFDFSKNFATNIRKIFQFPKFCKPFFWSIVLASRRYLKSVWVKSQLISFTNIQKNF